MWVHLLVPGGGVRRRVVGGRGGGAGGELGVHGVGLLEGEEVYVGGVIGHGVGLDRRGAERGVTLTNVSNTEGALF